ncbi:MAG: glycosyltransferase [Firmicutes bacterium]|nr:glycosyltransferase [Bacillota bacterium]
MERILTPALDYDLTIYDRMYNAKNNKFHIYPKKYQPYIVGGLDYHEMNKAYKKYKVFLNVNTVQKSPTMFACRVFELLASGTNVVSGYAVGIEKFFKNIVKLSKSKEETKEHIDKLLVNEELRDRLSLLGQREVFLKHTYKQRLETILDSIGYKYYKEKKKGVSVISCTNKIDSIKTIYSNFKRQKYNKKELIIIANNNKIDIKEWEKFTEYDDFIHIYSMEEKATLGECLNFAVKKSKYEIISKFDDDDYYGEKYLTDSINAFIYTEASIVGKRSTYVYFKDKRILAIRDVRRENQYIDLVTGPTLTFKKEIFKHVKFSKLNIGEDTKFQKDAKALGFKIYSIDRFNHVYLREKNGNNHTWKVKDEDILKYSVIVNKNIDDYKSIVCV